MLKTSIGRKAIVAITGIGLFLFIIGHLLGNLQIFLGRDTFNGYAESLKGMPELLWAARIGLLLFFVTHVLVAVQLWIDNRAARPIRYVMEDTVEASLASRTMLLSGLVILAFLLYHLAHFTLFMTDPKFGQLHQVMADGHHRHDAYSMVVMGFNKPFVVVLYGIAQVLLGFHLSHAFGSALQTLGLTCKSCRSCLVKFGRALAVLIVIGYLSIPLSILAGLVKLPTGVLP